MKFPRRLKLWLRFFGAIGHHIALRFHAYARGLKLPETMEIRTSGPARPKAGFGYNPLLRFPPNELCFCGKDSKAKDCCLPKVKRAIPLDQIPMLNKYVAEVQRLREERKQA